jgi:hypothetical protein
MCLLPYFMMNENLVRDVWLQFLCYVQLEIRCRNGMAFIRKDWFIYQILVPSREQKKNCISVSGSKREPQMILMM